VLSTVSAVVIVAGAAVDGARQAAATLDWLRQNGYQHLLGRACVVINHLIPGKPAVDVADLVAQFQRYVATGRVVVLPSAGGQPAEICARDTLSGALGSIHDRASR
jgi:MinD-like ATPase involved in chromosome partitioning or flagellar assembly